MVRIRINGKEITVAGDRYILEAAKDLGIHIPTMCHLEGLEPFATCMMCMVKDQSNGRLIPSCSVRPTHGMDIITDDEEIREARKTALELLLSDHLGDCEAPCRISCPAYMDIPRMNRLLAAGKINEALEVVRKDIALPSVLGRICPAPCEGACRRKPIDQPVSICMLKRYAGDLGSVKPEPIKSTGKKVAIIGGGPAGLSASYYLQLRGMACEIFDAGEKPGGALRYSVPKDDLPEKALDHDIKSILETGVQIRSSHSIGKREFEELRKKFDAVLVATGDAGGEMGDWGLDLTDKGLKAEKKTYASNLPGVFIAGNAIRTQKMAVRASAQGKEAAFSISQFLAGETIRGEPRKFNSRFGRLQESEFPFYLLESVPDKRFEPQAGNAEGYSLEEVRSEAVRCMHCDCRKTDDCRLRDLSEEYGADQKHFWDSTRKNITKSVQHEFVIYEAGKCIKCSLCVRLAEKHGEKIGFTFIGRGFDVEIGAPLNEELRSALTISAREVVEACPTGALAIKDI